MPEQIENKETKQKSVQAIEFNNLYYDTFENIVRVDNIFKILESKSDTLAYAYIKHDKDIYEKNTYDSHYNLLGIKGDLKKEHYHCYVKFNSPIPISRIEEIFNIKSTDYHVFKPKDFDNKLVYLTHMFHPDKVQYKVLDIKSNIQNYILDLYEERSKANTLELVPFIVDYVSRYDFDTKISLQMLIPILIKNGFKSQEIKGSIYLINSLLNEHNRLADETSSFIQARALEYMRDNKYLDEKIKQIVDNFGFGRIELDGETYIVCKDKNQSNKSQ